MATPNLLERDRSRQEPGTHGPVATYNHNAVFGSKGLYNATITRLQASKAAGVWSHPNIDASLAVNLARQCLHQPNYMLTLNRTTSRMCLPISRWHNTSVTVGSITERRLGPLLSRTLALLCQLRAYSSPKQSS